MGEFKYITGPALTVQKILNQWKHQFTITPIETKIEPGALNETYIYMLLWREPINSN